MVSFLQQTKVNIKIIIYLLTGAGTGILAGFLGLAGGVILVPIMVGFLNFTQHHAHGTSLVIIIPVALTGAILYILRGDINWMLMATIGPASVVGVVSGAKLMMMISAHRLRQWFGIYVIVVAVLMLMR